ncbi:transketolase [Simkania negevensis]|uniref:Transketolase n=1 Tax=Simkania negevensis TaxID=83561 RepID=A0ABS3AR06_9BACT|nr:transketolase [Simkania negevensis]
MLDEELKKQLSKVASTIAGLSIDAVEKANSGHPGLPLGCAAFGAYLFGHFMRYNPKNPYWLNRDRFVLSAGHGCMLLYSCLHLSGFDLSLEEIKQFRQLHSKTPGHPEWDVSYGIEATTGPLGQGIGNGVGMALGLKILANRFNTDQHELIDSKVIILAGDGCIQEGISSEVSAFAGHIGLNNVILVYDYNHITLDGPLAQSGSEDTIMRYKAYGWDVCEINGYNFDEMEDVFSGLRQNQTKPTLVLLHTIIGKGSPHKAGTHNAHGAPLGEEETKLTKQALGIPEEPSFYVPKSVESFFGERRLKLEEQEKSWQAFYSDWAKSNPERLQQYEIMESRQLPADIEQRLWDVEIKSPEASRNSSNKVIQELAQMLPQLLGGSADLSGSDKTMMGKYGLIAKGDFSGRNIKYGIREFGMSAMNNGLGYTRMFLPFCGTFLTFSDYMRNAIRLASLSKIHVIYQFTHDSIFLGEDGPTHQPVEHPASLRTIPNLHVIRPADNNEVKMAWLAALKYEGPTALILTRQKLPLLEHTNVPYAEGMGRGAYIVKKEKVKPDYSFFATGSEVSLALNVATELEKLGKDVRVVSMPCWAIFEHQSAEYQESIVGGDLGKRVAVEAAVEAGWHKYIGRKGTAICMESFGASAPASELAKEFGFTVESILERIMS